MLCHYKKVMELNTLEFIKLVRCTYSKNATFYPHDCKNNENEHAFYMFPDEDDKQRNAKEKHNLITFMFYNIAVNGIFVCELEAVIDKEMHYYTIVVK